MKEEKRMGVRKEIDQGYCLLFENEQGEGELVNTQRIKQLLDDFSHQIDLVVVAACNSKNVGQVFLDSGVKHVVCVESGKFVLDKAAIEFTRNFYQRILSGSTICSAYETAKAGVKFKIEKKEADIIVLLHNEELCVSSDPPCETLNDFNSGKMRCKSMHNQVKVMPKNIKNCNYKFRESQMSELLDHLLGKEE